MFLVFQEIKTTAVYEHPYYLCIAYNVDLAWYPLPPGGPEYVPLHVALKNMIGSRAMFIKVLVPAFTFLKIFKFL